MLVADETAADGSISGLAQQKIGEGSARVSTRGGVLRIDAGEIQRAFALQGRIGVRQNEPEIEACLERMLAVNLGHVIEHLVGCRQLVDGNIPLRSETGESGNTDYRRARDTGRKRFRNARGID